ncbi:MAG: SPOR domain-containing protein [Acidithiobacillus sp.]
MAGDGGATGQRRWGVVMLALPVLLLGVGLAFYLGHQQVPEAPRAAGPTLVLPLNGQAGAVAPTRSASPSLVRAEPLPQRAEAAAPATSPKAVPVGPKTAGVEQPGHAASRPSPITHPTASPSSPIRYPAVIAAGPAHPATPPRVLPVAPPAGWYVQVGAFGAVRPARQLLDRVRSRGFSGRLAELPGSALQHVWIGPLPDRAAALAVTARLRQDLQLSGFPRHWP